MAELDNSNSNSKSVLQLSYFNARGLAETSRLILAIVGENYQDLRYPLTIDKTKTPMFSKPEFDLDKKMRVLERSFNKLPFLKVGEDVIFQSKAIERYLAKTYNLMGSSLVEEALIDGLCEVIRDYKTEYQQVKKEKNEESLKKWFTETLPEKVGLLELNINMIHAVGGRVSLADIVMFEFFTQYFDDVVSINNVLNGTEKVRSIVSNIGENKKIIKWLETRPMTDF